MLLSFEFEGGAHLFQVQKVGAQPLRTSEPSKRSSSRRLAQALLLRVRPLIHAIIHRQVTVSIDHFRQKRLINFS